MPVRPHWRNQTGTIASLKCQMMLSRLSQPRAVYSRCSWDCFETNVGWIPDYSLAGPESGWGTPAWQHVIMETDCSCFDKYVNGPNQLSALTEGQKVAARKDWAPDECLSDIGSTSQPQCCFMCVAMDSNELIPKRNDIIKTKPHYVSHCNETTRRSPWRRTA